MMNIRPKKSLGQHFLRDMDIARRVAETLADYRGMPVLEVGPGTGVLTRFLLDEGHQLSVVELDTES
ncbi:MAG: 16S rRNA (adenine(1518)-N(6)/adenine(1519)-N(6))-dimethyltransferase, partial [Tannerella sp.]|nr:16S rRNA (adenine(1518)-N(6)/adenine(1519)-N(6))-dimethyltransferase [Tannerella sp.]